MRGFCELMGSPKPFLSFQTFLGGWFWSSSKTFLGFGALTGKGKGESEGAKEEGGGAEGRGETNFSSARESKWFLSIFALGLAFGGQDLEVGV